MKMMFFPSTPARLEYEKDKKVSFDTLNVVCTDVLFAGDGIFIGTDEETIMQNVSKMVTSSFPTAKVTGQEIDHINPTEFYVEIRWKI